MAPLVYTRPYRTDTSFSGIIKSDNPGIYFRFGEPSGTTANNEIGVVNGTYFGTYTLGATGALTDGNTAVDFAWPNGRAGGTSLPVSGGTTTSWSVEMWAYSDIPGSSYSGGPGAIPSGIFFDMGGGSQTRFQWFYATEGDHGNFGIYNPVGASFPTFGGNAGYHGEYHFYSLVVNGTTATMYIDGQPFGSSIALGGTITLQATIPTLVVGANFFSNQGFFDGRMDEFIMFDYALTPTQIENHYTSGIPGLSQISNQTFQLRSAAITGLSDGQALTNGDWTPDSVPSPATTLNLVGSGAPTYETNEVNSLPAVRFQQVAPPNNEDLTTDNSFTGLVTATAGTTYVVAKPDGTITDQILMFEWGIGLNNWYLVFTQSGTLYYDHGTVGGGERISTSVPAGYFNQWNIYEIYRNSTTGWIKMNNSTVLSGSFSGAGGIGASAFLRIGGSNFTTGSKSQADMAEMITYDRALTSQERGSIYLSLKNKYNL